MGLPNLKLRGGSYHWRRKIMVAGQPLPLSISLRTGNFYRARLISDRLSVAVEGLRMACRQFTAAAAILIWRVANFAVVPPLQMRVMDAAADAPNFASAMNIGAFNLGNAIGAASGGGVIGAGLGLPGLKAIVHPRRREA